MACSSSPPAAATSLELELSTADRSRCSRVVTQETVTSPPDALERLRR
jgi:hypothetical protein